SLYTWDLASFGRESLPPGESLVLRMSYAPAADYDCASVDTGTIVEATVDGKTERYGVRPDEQPQLGECRSIDDEEGSFVPGGRGGPVGFGRGGEGPGDSTFDLTWAAMCLAAGGAALVALATLVRRKVRR
ncbi:MAG: hypothetical protein IMZ46_11565, partial [Acidobacteria bacterium]|nr:hypothetical protein [Acidobacteriota bacterium]